MSTTLHTVHFSTAVTFTSQVGISFVNTTTSETASLVTSLTLSPANIIEYDVTWSVDPVPNDVVEFRYAGGNYVDGDAVPMADANLTVTNCLN